MAYTKSNFTTDVQFREQLFQKYNVKKSALLFHNYSNKCSSYVELSSQYLLLYENIHVSNNHFSLIEFNNAGYYSVHTKYTDVSQLGEQPLHRHDYCEITYVISGELHLRIEDQTYTLHAGEYSLCNSHVRHAEHHDSNCEFVLIMLQSSFIQDLVRLDYQFSLDNSSFVEYPVIRCLTSFLETETFSSAASKEYIVGKQKNFSLTQNDEMLCLINDMIHVLSERIPGNHFLFMSNLCRFLGKLNSQQEYSISSYHIKSDSLEDLFIRTSFIIEERKGNISRSDLQEILGYSGDYLTRVIRKFTGMNFMEYAQEFSLKEAAHLLVETDINISEICLILGYTNRTHFNKLFQRKYRIPPKAYRLSHKKSPSSDLPRAQTVSHE